MWRTEKTEIARKKRCRLLAMKIAQNLLLIIPFRPPDSMPDLSKMNAQAFQLFCLIIGNVVIKDNHAAAREW